MKRENADGYTETIIHTVIQKPCTLYVYICF